MCVCVRKSERQIERQREGGREGGRKGGKEVVIDFIDSKTDMCLVYLWFGRKY